MYLAVGVMHGDHPARLIATLKTLSISSLLWVVHANDANSTALPALIGVVEFSESLTGSCSAGLFLSFLALSPAPGRCKPLQSDSSLKVSHPLTGYAPSTSQHYSRCNKLTDKPSQAVTCAHEESNMYGMLHGIKRG